MNIAVADESHAKWASNKNCDVSFFNSSDFEDGCI